MNTIAVVRATKTETLDALAEYPHDVLHVDNSDEAINAYEHNAADIIMKGDLHTDEFLAPIVRRVLPFKGARLSHVYRLTTPADRVVYVTDGAVNISPDYKTKAEIIRNAVRLWNVFDSFRLGNRPNVALLSATEDVNLAMPASIDAERLTRTYKGMCNLYGPLAFDNAWSSDAAAKKGITNPVAGKADILVVPDIMAGNMLAKSMVYVGHCDAEGIVLGAKCPIVLTSRADSLKSKVDSMLFADEYLRLLNEEE